jgi:hypothetical protein
MSFAWNPQIHCRIHESLPLSQVNLVHKKLKKKLNSVAFSPQANYTDRENAACWRSYCQLLRIEGVAWSAQRIPWPLIRFS